MVTLLSPWYAIVDDLIGGYAVGTKDAPASDTAYGGRHPTAIEVAHFTCENAARHIATLHNAWLDDLHALIGDR